MIRSKRGSRTTTYTPEIVVNRIVRMQKIGVLSNVERWWADVYLIYNNDEALRAFILRPLGRRPMEFVGAVDQGDVAKLNLTYFPELLRVSLEVSPHPHLEQLNVPSRAWPVATRCPMLRRRFGIVQYPGKISQAPPVSLSSYRNPGTRGSRDWK